MQQVRDLFTGREARCVDFLHELGRCGAMGVRRERLRQLDVCRVVGRRTPRDGVLTGLGEHLKLVRCEAADRAGVRSDRPEAQSQAGEDSCICVVHDLIRPEHRFLVDVERVRVLHDELARAHDAESWPYLVAELDLDMVKVEWKLLIALDLLARKVGDDLFRRRLHDEVALVAILEPQQLRPVLVPAPRLLPELGGLHDRHQKLYRAGGVHLLPHDRLDLSQHA